MKIYRPEYQPWMGQDYHRICAHALVAQLYHDALDVNDRAARIWLGRIAKRLLDGPWHFFEKGQAQ